MAAAPGHTSLSRPGLLWPLGAPGNLGGEGAFPSSVTAGSPRTSRGWVWGTSCPAALSPVQDRLGCKNVVWCGPVFAQRCWEPWGLPSQGSGGRTGLAPPAFPALPAPPNPSFPPACFLSPTPHRPPPPQPHLPLAPLLPPGPLPPLGPPCPARAPPAGGWPAPQQAGAAAARTCTAAQPPASRSPAPVGCGRAGFLLEGQVSRSACWLHPAPGKAAPGPRSPAPRGWSGFGLASFGAV